MNAPISAYRLERVISLAQSTVDMLRTEHGQVIETGEDILAALAEENVKVDDILRGLIRASLDAQANEANAKARIDNLKTRKERYANQHEKYRATAAAVMDALSLTSFPDAEFSLTISPGQAKVIITDETKLPKKLTTRTVVITPNKAAIKAELDAGRAVSGAMLSQPAPILTVRTR